MKKLLLFLILLTSFNFGYGQCSNCDGQWPANTQSTTSSSFVTVATDISGGDFAEYSVTDGTTYIWTTCDDSDFDTQLTLSSGNCGGTNLAYNDDDCGQQSTITWTATFTGNVYVLVSKFSCKTNTTNNMTLKWRIVPHIDGDCAAAETVCSSGDIDGNPTGSGNYDELNSTNAGCLDPSEHYSKWLFFHTKVDNCEVCFDLTTADGTDYDWAIWSGISCPPTTQPIRCSSANANGSGNTSTTGMRNTSTDESEGEYGDGFVKCITANIGDEFTILIDNWNGTSEDFTLTWNLCQSDALDCTNLPVDFITSEYDCSTNLFRWSTASEMNNDYFTIEVSNNLTDPIVYIVAGNGNSNIISSYVYKLDINNKYIQLYQTDYDGTKTLLNTNYVSCNTKREVSIYPNPSDGDVTINGDFNTIMVYDMVGREVQVELVDNRLSGISSGVYIVIIDGYYKFKLFIE